MAEQHICEWSWRYEGTLPRCTGCGRWLDQMEAEAMLNEYETLKAENKAWRATMCYDSVTDTIHFNRDSIVDILEGKDAKEETHPQETK